MAQYRIFKTDPNGLIIDGADIECATDAEALDRAAKLLSGCARIEVWSSTKRVGILSPTREIGSDRQAP